MIFYSDSIDMQTDSVLSAVWQLGAFKDNLSKPIVPWKIGINSSITWIVAMLEDILNVEKEGLNKQLSLLN